MIRLYTVLVFVAIATLGVYAGFVMQKFDFVGNTTLLLVPENSLIAENADNITNNIVVISEKSVDTNTDIEKYNAKVNIERIDGTNMIKFETFADSEETVLFVERGVLKGALVEIEKFYNVNSDFSIKIVGVQSVEQTTAPAFIVYGMFMIIALGCISIIALLFNFIFTADEENKIKDIDAKQIFQKYNENKQSEKELSDEDILNFVDSELVVQSDLDENVGVEVEENENDIETAEDKNIEEEKVLEQTVKTFEGVSMPEGLPTTPDNLPIVDISDFGGDTAEEVDNENNEQTPQEDIEAGKTEPTEEELKARLNELLNGKL